MGTIQNSVNQMLGTTAGAALGAMHVVEQTKSNQLANVAASEKAQEEAKSLINEAENVVDTQRATEESIEAIKEDLANKENWTGPFKDDKTGKYITKDKYQIKRELALKEMEEKQKAIKTQKFDLNARMDLFNKRLDTLKLKKDLQPRIDRLATQEQLNKIDYIRGGNK